MTDQATIWTDTETRDKLRQVADFYRRSMAAQLRWMVDQELEKLDGKEGLSSAQQVVNDIRLDMAQQNALDVAQEDL